MMTLGKQLVVSYMLRIFIQNKLDAFNYKHCLRNCFVEKDKCIVVEIEFPNYHQDVFDMLWDFSDLFQLNKLENGSCLYILKFNLDNLDE